MAVQQMCVIKLCTFLLISLQSAAKQQREYQGVYEATSATSRTSSITKRLLFQYESRNTLKSFYLFITVKTITKLNLGNADKFEIKIYKISRRGLSSSDNTESSHYTLLFCRVQKRNAPRIMTYVHSYCFAIVLLNKELYA